MCWEQTKPSVNKYVRIPFFGVSKNEVASASDLVTSSFQYLCLSYTLY